MNSLRDVRVIHLLCHLFHRAIVIPDRSEDNAIVARTMLSSGFIDVSTIDPGTIRHLLEDKYICYVSRTTLLTPRMPNLTLTGHKVSSYGWVHD